MVPAEKKPRLEQAEKSKICSSINEKIGHDSEEIQTVLSVCFDSKNLGAAIFEINPNKIKLTGSLLHRPHGSDEEVMTWFYSVYRTCSPQLVLVSTKTTPSIINKLRKYTTLTIVPSDYYDYPKALQLLDNLKLNQSKVTSSVHMSLQAFIDKGNFSSVRACGALLSWANRQDFLHEIEIESIETTKTDGNMLIHPVDLTTLDIFRIDEHPSLIRNAGRGKEGFSLMSLLDRTKSLPGRKLLRNWLANPLTDIPTINRRLNSVDLLMKNSVSDQVQKMLLSLRDVKDIARYLENLDNYKQGFADWCTIVKSVNAIATVLHNLRALLDNCYSEELQETDFADYSCYEMDALEEVVQSFDCIDWEKSLEEKRIIPRMGVSNALDEIRSVYESIDGILGEITQDCKDLYGNELASRMRPTYMPSIGFLILVQTKDSIKEKLFIAPSDFEYLFKQKLDDPQARIGSGLYHIFFRNNSTKFLDNKFGDIFGAMKELEEKIQLELHATIARHKSQLVKLCIRCAHLDVFLSFAQVANEFSYVKPELTLEPAFEIEQARHPLIEHNCEEQYIPNDIRLFGGSENSIMMLSGPNMSGKTALLKILGIFSIMAQAGCFVPATTAKIGIVDRLFTRLESFDTSTTLDESSFTIDVQQVSRMLRCSTSSSLLLIDEFGKGTTAIDGASLLIATMNHLSEIEPNIPRTVVISHFDEVLEVKLFRNPAAITYWHMAIVFHQNNEESTENIGEMTDNTFPVPLYKLVEGKYSNSYGIECAKRAGVSMYLLKRAKRVLRDFEAGLLPLAEVISTELAATITKLEVIDWTTASEEVIDNFINEVEIVFEKEV